MRLAAWWLAALLLVGPIAPTPLAAAAAPSEPAKSVALLSVQFLNDHEDLEPTTDAERARVALIASLFKAKLEASGRYRFVSVPPMSRLKLLPVQRSAPAAAASSAMAKSSAPT